jgi:penicillin G amidase
MTMASGKRSLSPPAWLLFYASTVSGLGNGMRISALEVFAAALTRSPVLVASVAVASQLPIICVGPFAGVLVDHLDRRRTLWICNAAEAGVLGALIALIYLGLAGIATLAGMAFALGCVQSLAVNLGQAVIPELVDPDMLDLANSRLQSGPFISSQLIGTPLGPILFVVRRVIPFFVDAGSFAISAALVFGIRSRRPAARTGPPLTLRRLRSETAEGIAWLWRHRVIRSICLLTALSNVALLGVLAIAVLYALEDLHVSRAVYGLLLLVIAIGGLLGLVIAPRLVTRLGRGRTLQLAFAVCPVSFAIGGFTSNAWLAALAFALAGAGVTISTVVSATLRQLLIPRHLFGRVNGAFWLVVGGVQPVGALFGGFVASEFGLRAPFLVGALLQFAAAAAALPLLSNRAIAPMVDAARAEASTRAAYDDEAAWTGSSRWDSRLMRTIRHAVSASCAVGVSIALLALLGAGFGSLPALGTALNPGRGVWTSAASGAAATSQTLRIPGLSRPARVWFTSAGIASIQAASDADAFLALGYVHARFRLTQMDLERRLGEGRLSQLVGPSGVTSDEFELQLGLLRTAQAEWLAMPAGSLARVALTSYAAGVNDWIRQADASHAWPALYTLAGVRPALWTPVDSLVVQEVLTQELDFSVAPLDYAVLEQSLGAKRTMQWFPVLPTDAQVPFDPGPYDYRGISPFTAGNADAETTASVMSHPAGTTRPPTDDPARGGAMAAVALLGRLSALPAVAIQKFPDSNAWASNGPAVAGGGAMLAGDPHLSQTLPAYWYEVALTAPGLDVTGATVPGVPGVVLGHDMNIAWSITNTENQSTVYYDEQTSPRRPDEYYWRGAWRRMQQIAYVIPVRGARPVHLTARLTVHGPVITQVGQTTSVDWMGNYPSGDIEAILSVDEAADFKQFRMALKGWHAPTLNFVYADRHGNIGEISAGYYPLVAHGSPWLPLPGTGAYDVIGTIPYDAVPQLYDPPDHIIVTANQRPVGPGYPYFIGTTLDNFDYGYRADQIYASISNRRSMTMADYADLQNNVTDHLATLIVPRLLSALAGAATLTAAERTAGQVLSRWNDAMTAGSAGASIWWTFWTDYLSAVFGPWWKHAKVPVGLDPTDLTVSPGLVSLDQDLEAWTLGDPGNDAFTAPGGATRGAPKVMQNAFAAAVSSLSHRLGPVPSSWAWGRLHSREFPSLTQATSLGYGPRPAPGDAWTIDAADGGMVSDFGPSWRMIVDWNGSGETRAEAIYPGGQAENPTSPWYENLVADWWDGRYLPMAATAAGSRGTTVWTLRPSSEP